MVTRSISLACLARSILHLPMMMMTTTWILMEKERTRMLKWKMTMTKICTVSVGSRVMAMYVLFRPWLVCMSDSI